MKASEDRQCRQCSRCGKCCSYFVIGVDRRDLPEATRFYLDIRCTMKEGDYWLVYAPCRYLVTDGTLTRCGCEDNKPEICRIYNGLSRTGKHGFWVPKGCTMAGEA